MINVLISKIKKSLGNYKWALFIITFLLHESFVILLNSGVINLTFSAGDQTTYHTFASQISDLIINGTYTWGAVYNWHWYPLFTGIIYSIFGKSMIIGASINAILIAFSSVLLFDVVAFLNRIPRKTIFWVVLLIMNGYASLMFHSSLLLKESWIVFLIISIFYLALKLYNKEKFNWPLLLIILFLCLALRNLRFFIGFAVIVGFFVGWFVESKIILKKRIIYGIIIIFIFTFTTSFLTGGGIGKSNSFLEYINPKFIYTLREQYFKNGGTTTNINVVKKEINNLNLIKETKNNNEPTVDYNFSITGVIKSSLTVIFGPFPWQLSFKKYIIASLDLVFWYMILFLGCFGILKIKLKSSLVYLIPSFIIFTGLIVGVDNLGALLRYRIPLTVIFAIFVPFGVDFLFNFKKHENTLHNN